MANVWKETTFRGAPGFYEGFAVHGGAVSATGVVIDSNLLVYRGRDKFPGGTFFFRGEAIESSTGLIGERPVSPIVLELTRNDIYSSRVSLRVYEYGKDDDPYFRGVSEILDPKSNPIFHVDRPVLFNDVIQASVSIPMKFLPKDVREAWAKCSKLALSVRPDLIREEGEPNINVRIGKDFDVNDLMQPTTPQLVKDIRFAFGKRANGDFVGQLTFFGEELRI